MQADVPLVNFAPLLRLSLLVLLIALGPLALVWLRQRGRNTSARLAALTALTLFLTFDLVVFGSFTRLTDSGLGCPDWPGCYGHVSPVGASAHIQAAEAAIPDGPVTPTKAWIEMIHRYLAMSVGLLILVMAIAAWWDRKTLPYSPLWPTLTLAWVIVQGLFGKYTVTLKLYPAVVTAHLLGGLVLLALLVRQHVAWKGAQFDLPAGLRRLLLASMAVLWLQLALGGWVSTNYAVLACTGFPQCNDQWWPAMNFAQGFTLLRELGMTASGEVMSMEALVAIHMTHRLFAWAVVGAVTLLAWRLWQLQGGRGRRWAWTLWALVLWQLGSGLSNVVLGWPLAAALGHSAGAAALVCVTTWLWCVSATASPYFARSPAARSLTTA